MQLFGRKNPQKSVENSFENIENFFEKTIAFYRTV